MLLASAVAVRLRLTEKDCVAHSNPQQNRKQVSDVERHDRQHAREPDQQDAEA